MEMISFTTDLEQVYDGNSVTTESWEEPYFSNFILATRIATGLASGLSLLGAITVIIYQLFFHHERDNIKVVRLIIIMLSIADLLVAISHIWGATQDLPRFIQETTSNFSYADTQCTAQAVFAVFGSLSSSMWMLALVSCVFITYCMPGLVGAQILNCGRVRTIVSVFTFCNLLCWGFPFLLVIVLGRLYHLGYAETADIGWCYISLLATESDVKLDEKLVLPLSYEGWMWLIILMIAICIVGYVVVFFCIRFRLCGCGETATQPASNAPSGVTDSRGLGDTIDPAQELIGGKQCAHTNQQNNGGEEQVYYFSEGTDGGANWRPVLAGVFLLILRLPSAIIDEVLFVNKTHHRELWLGVVILIAAVGDSLQGLVNSVLFVWGRPQIYKRCMRYCSGYTEVQGNNTSTA